MALTLLRLGQDNDVGMDLPGTSEILRNMDNPFLNISFELYRIHGIFLEQEVQLKRTPNRLIAKLLIGVGHTSALRPF